MVEIIKDWSTLKKLIFLKAAVLAEAVWHTVSGAIVSFVTGRVKPLRSVIVNFSPIQNLNGYDYPWIGGAGKNLFHVTKNVGTMPVLGVIYTVNSEDNSITCNGTAEGNVTLNVMQFTAKAGVTYTLSGTPSSVTTGDIFVRFHGPEENTYTFNYLADLKSGRKVTFSFEEDTTGYIDVRIGTEQTVNNLVFKPQIEVGSSATSFAPYENLCPITGRTGIGVEQSTRNFFNATSVELGKISTDNGQDMTGNNSDRTPEYSCVKPDTDYIISGWKGQARIYYYGKNKIYLSSEIVGNGAWHSGKETEYVRVAGNVDGWWTPNAMIRLASDTDSTYAVPTSKHYAIMWETEAGTVYGGYVNNNGKLVAEWKSFKIKDKTWTYDATYTRFSVGLSDSKIETTRTQKLYCSAFQNYATGGGIASVPDYSIYNGGTNQVIYIKIPDYTDSASFVSAFGEETIVYPLATPIEYDIDAVEIESLLGDNVMWSDAGDITVIYSE